MGIKHEPQLDGSRTQAVDCGVASTVMAVDYASSGALHPSSEQVRKRMADRDTTNPTDWQRALVGFKKQVKDRGLKPIRSSRVQGRDIDRLHKVLFDRKRPAIVALNYGTVARMSPRLWSSNSFRGGHAVLLRVGKVRDGKEMVKVFDPLADGRRLGGKKVVNGPRWWQWSVVSKACEEIEDASGNRIFPAGDRWIGLVVWKSKPVKPDKPDEEDEPDGDADIEDTEVEPEDDDSIDTLADAAAEIDDALQAVVEAKAIGDDRALEVALAGLLEAREALRPFMPPDSTNTSDSGNGLDVKAG